MRRGILRAVRPCHDEGGRDATLRERRDRCDKFLCRADVRWDFRKGWLWAATRTIEEHEDGIRVD